MSRAEETRPASVTEGSKQAGETTVRQRWPWVEPTVWTERMLETLERGVKGNKWFALIDKVYDPRALQSAWMAVAANEGAAGGDGQPVAQFAARRDEELARLGDELHKGTYRPQPVRRVWIDKAGSREKRPLGIPAVRDRVVQSALRQVLEPIFEREFAAQSYGFRPGRGCKDALRRVSELLEAGALHIVDADLKGYFDSIPHERLLARVRERVSDGRVMQLIESFLSQGVLTEMGTWEATESGTPQGAVISPLLANLYLHPLDLLMQQSGIEMVRYADDFILLCRHREEALEALRRVREWVENEGLTLHPEKTKVVDMTEPQAGFDFLGYHFHHGGKRWPRKKSECKLRERIRPLTKRTNGQSLAVIIGRLNPILRGWYGYFRHSRRGLLRSMDGWVRGRLRSILRKRNGRRGRGRGRDQQCWTNQYFACHGLFSLHEAQVTELQSHR
jgi:RNA-directed DNA polymerase